jgi:hypothetical protein
MQHANEAKFFAPLAIQCAVIGIYAWWKAAPQRTLSTVLVQSAGAVTKAVVSHPGLAAVTAAGVYVARSYYNLHKRTELLGLVAEQDDTLDEELSDPQAAQPQFAPVEPRRVRGERELAEELLAQMEGREPEQVEDQEEEEEEDDQEPEMIAPFRCRVTQFQRFILAEVKVHLGNPTYTAANVEIARRKVLAVIMAERADIRGTDLEKHVRKITALVFAPTVSEIQLSQLMGDTYFTGWTWWFYKQYKALRGQFIPLTPAERRTLFQRPLL